jgi:hypothetical protein
MSAEPIDFAAEGLLDGLEGQQRSERLALLRQLADDGVALAELRRATAAGSIMYLPADRVIVGSERYTAGAGSRLAFWSPRAGRWVCRYPSRTRRCTARPSCRPRG